MTHAYIYDAVRTPRGRGKKNGSLHEITALQLATQQLEALRDRTGLDTAHVDDVILGCVSPVGEQGADIARAAVLNADYAESVAGVQVNRFCASGLEAVNIAAAKVLSGQAGMAIGGGVEAMSRVPMGSDGGALGVDPELAFDHYMVPQGVSADLIATKYGYSRDDVDAYAVESQKRAKKAWDEKRFEKSVVAVKNQLGLVQLDHDEHMRPETDMQSLASLKPAFKDLSAFVGLDKVAIQRYPDIERIEFVHHAGNSSGIVDGAAAVLIGTREMGEKLGLKPRARIRAMASIGSEPTIMLTGPAPSARKALEKAGMSPSDIDLYEMNEAFAAVVLRFMEDLGVDHDRTNVNGGAIALGHPLGATGAMILGTVLDELERTGKGTGLATLCVGGGMGTATIIERI
ncbi:acetyl-CoA C-acetyltransferase [Glycocaulis profundi]|nr:acetyl-CoA C-acetyltransferase [Glycocaulis profundi]